MFVNINKYLYILYIFACYLFYCLCIYSRTLAHVATVTCWLYPTLNKFYLILSYLNNTGFVYIDQGPKGDPELVKCFNCSVFSCKLSVRIVLNILHYLPLPKRFLSLFYSDTIMSAMALQITVVSIVCSTGSSGADQRKHESSALLSFLRGSNRGAVDSPHKGQ